MRSKGFIAGFSKTAGILGTAVKKVLNVNNVLTGVGAVMEGSNGYKKMVAAGTRPMA